MAKESRREQSADELKVEIARSRDRLTRDLRAFRRDIDIPRRIKRSFRQQPAPWITAAVAVGVLLIMLPARRKVVEVEAKPAKRKKVPKGGKILEAGFVIGALRFAATLLKPMVVSFVTRKLRGFVADSHASPRKYRSVI
ncbi:MAG TPA: hypothetical protein VJ719_10365 [Chthoniobacterales bacterium]|nr:hypothetical protein [Chthoniobacterales bacterium]